MAVIEGTGFDLLQEADRTWFAMRKALVPRLDGSISEVRIVLFGSARWFGRGENGLESAVGRRRRMAADRRP
ncbi:MAG: hypothetical protein CMJ27_08530 [Phycisphaerae bacterium]|nr:hypothetical protein [Phycisphaerae bacterium]